MDGGCASVYLSLYVERNRRPALIHPARFAERRGSGYSIGRGRQKERIEYHLSVFTMGKRDKEYIYRERAHHDITRSIRNRRQGERQESKHSGLTRFRHFGRLTSGKKCPKDGTGRQPGLRTILIEARIHRDLPSRRV